jgi:YbbR domain-containing protein
MPFQDIDEVSSVEAPRAPSRVERLLRKIFVEDWNLKLLSLGITLLLWFVVTGQNTPINTHASVQLRFIRPDALEISNDPPRSVDVLLTGSKHKLDEMDRASLIATVDISDQRAGERPLRLADRAHIDLLPDGVKIDAFQPSAITIRLEPIIQKQLSVEPKIEGTPADGYEVYSVRLDKTTVSASGPASNVYAIPKALTETISVAGRKESFTASNVSLNIADPKVDVLNPLVTVDIEIGEKRTEKVFENVPITTDANIHLLQRTASITLAGPRDLLTQLRPSDVTLRLNGDGTPILDLRPPYEGKIFLKATKPEKFVAAR